MDRKRQKLTLEKIKVQTQCEEEEIIVLRQKITSIEAELKLKNEEKEHLVKRVTLLEQELARKETQLKLKNEEQEHLVERVTSLEQELSVKETQLKLKNKEQEHLEMRVTSLEQELKKKETQLQLINEPFDALPNEIIVEVFKRLTQNELGKIARVCQRWNELTKSPVLWQKVHVEFHISHNEAFMAFINRLSCSPSSITVGFPRIINSIQPLDFQELCVALQGKCHQLKELVFVRFKFTSSLSSVVDLCTQFLPNMTSLALPFSEFCDFPTIVQCTDTSRITVLDVCGLPGINHLNKSLFLRMTDLKDLGLSCTSLNDSWFNNEITFLNQIEVLHLGLTNISYRAFQEIKEHGQNLKELYICVTQLGDSDLNFDTPAFPRLKVICISRCPNVTHEGVVSLLQSCPSLQNIYVDKEVALFYARHSYVIANPGKLGIVKSISCRKHFRKYF